MKRNSEFELVKNPIDFDLIRIRKYKPQRLTRQITRNVFGIDTETLDGYCKLICDDKSNHVMSKYIDRFLNVDVDTFLKFLTSHRFRSSHNFFFNLNYDVNSIIKYFPKKLLEILYKDLNVEYNGYDIFFIPKKLLRITRNKNVYKFYDIAQFLGGSLESNAKKYLGLDKYVEPIDRKRLGTEKDYWKPRLESIIKYCINDAKLTMQLGKMVNDTLIENLKLYPDSFVSKASLCKEFVRKSVELPDVNKIPRNALKYAFYSYSGGRFETFKKGNVGKCSLFDINSAYPHTIRNLLDVTKGKWKRVTSLHEEADYGFYLAKVYVKYNRISPIGIPIKSGVIAYPILQMNLYLTKDELLEYEKYLDYDIIDGWEFYANEFEFPFKEYIDMVYDFKNKTDKSLYEYNLYKIMMNSLYGCFYEKQVRTIDNEVLIYTGKLFNPIYATMITAKTRINLFKTSEPYFNKIVAYATDSILFEGNIDLPISNELGDWNFESFDNTIVLKGGIYRIGNQMKNRGIKKASELITPFGKYKSIFHYIRKNPNLTEYPILTNRPLTFIEVLLHHLKHNIEKINQFVDITYTIDLNKDYKRIWEDEFKCGKELFEKSIDSIPLILQP